MNNNFIEAFRCYEGQPVKIFTDDGRIHTGIVLDTWEDNVQIIDKCGRLLLVSLRHIDAMEKPQMGMRCCRKDKHEHDKSGRKPFDRDDEDVF